MYKKSKRYSLGKLVDPECFNEPLICGTYDKLTLLRMLEQMLKIRQVEEKISNALDLGQVKTPCHLGIGQEAIPVGISEHLNTKDYVFSTHRSHSHYLSMGGSVYELLAEVLGKAEGASKGMGGSMHLYAGAQGFVGSVPIVGGTIPIAVGAGMAAKMDKGEAVAVCYFGDGAAEEGVLHESLNLAAIYQLPVLFVCENNLYSSHLDINLRQPSDSIARFADAHCIEATRVDGNDVIAVADAAQSAIEMMRHERVPYFLEAVTYRWLGHVGSDENIDVGVRRSAEEIVAWKKRDPIKRLFDAMSNKEFLNSLAYEKIKEKISQSVSNAFDMACEAPYPEVEALYQMVYKD